MSVSKIPVAMFELIPHGSGSGFVREDTVDTPERVEIIHPKNRKIINRSAVKEKQTLKDGSEAFVNVPTRYIYGCPFIKEKEQKDAGILPNPMQDLIMFKNGLLTVPKDGATVGLYLLMQGHAQNLTNPDRLEHLTPIFRELKPAETSAGFNEAVFVKAEAITYINQLITRKGKDYLYQEDRIDALCDQNGVFADDYPSKVRQLLSVAELDPLRFLKEAKKTEQVTLIEVSHGLKLELIVFEGNTAMYKNENIKIKSLTGNLGDDKKTKALADWFQTTEGKVAYEQYKEKLAALKQAKLEQN